MDLSCGSCKAMGADVCQVASEHTLLAYMVSNRARGWHEVFCGWLPTCLQAFEIT